jgi:diadenosine tetraphosphate (Ap4A) HIT family hydrolase
MRYRDFLKELHVCPFCVPQDRMLAENALGYLTYALAPYHRHHLLVIPKRHTLHFLELSKEEGDEVNGLIRTGFSALKRLGY